MVIAHHGLDAAGFLLLAERHLLKAREQLDPTDQPVTVYMAGEAIVRATLAARHALKLLKEEPSEEDTISDDMPRDDHWYHENPNY